MPIKYMTKTKITQNSKENINLNTTLKDDSVKITGTLTSQIQLRGEGTKEPYYYTFVKLKGQNVDLPVIFKLTDKMGFSTKPYLEKGMELELFGHYSNSDKSIRKSFTATNYRLCNEKKVRKKCFGCLDPFTCSQSENYDYCSECEINDSRYIPRESQCPECGDGSGIIKFPNQAPRNCKTCYLANQVKKEENIFAK
ncbi:621_t:CDS:1 [Ambispora gerdemannii]|uniref:621_t:CDS:1 n=1 Tax=Ambispora gerdemannii TaxID=144530 RepID=A0A9N9GZY6_9GLOM|nr:621_t:CDS:1 [Ambispora gerdemannii]